MTRRKKSWKELSRAQQTAMLVLMALQLGLQAAALADLRKRPAAQVNGPKAAWVAGSFINYLGPLAYFRLGRRKS